MFLILLPSCKSTGDLTQVGVNLELFSDSFATADEIKWKSSDAWNNGDPFWVGWRQDHITYDSGAVVLQLDNTPCADDQTRCSNQPYASGELQSKEKFGFASYQVRLKAAQGNGIVTAFFLYTGPSEGTIHDEIDIEFLGKDTTQVQFNYFTDGVGGHETVVDLGFDASQAFHDYKIIRTTTSIIWYVDGVQKHQVTQSSKNPLPQNSTKVILNLWAGTGVDSWLSSFDYSSPVLAYFDSVLIKENQ